MHFFAPTDLKPLRTHAIFVLDVSGSMVGHKLPQVKEAMDQILSEIHSDDFFTLIVFSDFAQVNLRGFKRFILTDYNYNENRLL